MKIEAYAVWVDGVLEGIIRTPDAKVRAEIRAEALRSQGKTVEVLPYTGKPRAPV